MDRESWFGSNVGNSNEEVRGVGLVAGSWWLLDGAGRERGGKWGTGNW
jgi:hypothetical protein